MDNTENLKEEIRKQPYKFICKYVEDIYPFTGGRVFEVLSLVPISLILPDLPFLSKQIRSNINMLFLSPSGSGKSSMCSQFAKFTYYPIEGRSYTPADLEEVIKRSPQFSLIIEDYNTMASDERTLKIIEGLIGEEKVLDRHTIQKDIRMNVNGIAMLCGVPEDVSDKLTTGTLFRTVCVALTYSDEQHSRIGKHISDNIGKGNHFGEKEKAIVDYYKTLQLIQAGEEIQDKLHPVTSYNIPEEFKARLFKRWDGLTNAFRRQAPINWLRELHDGYRFLIAHAFLNYFNRKIEKGVIHIQEEDCKIAEILMEKTMQTKYSILMSERMARGIKSINDFNRIMSDPRIPLVTKHLIPVHLQNKILR